MGFENHLNYFHKKGRGIDMPLARGLAAFLNSTLVDAYFRQFNGHTQVNATDLRSLTAEALHDRAWAEQVGAGARQRALTEHTYMHRMWALLETVAPQA